MFQHFCENVIFYGWIPSHWHTNWRLHLKSNFPFLLVWFASFVFKKYKFYRNGSHLNSIFLSLLERNKFWQIEFSPTLMFQCQVIALMENPIFEEKFFPRQNDFRSIEMRLLFWSFLYLFCSSGAVFMHTI